MIAAIVPAAGRSERMGTGGPKLLLPIAGMSVIARVIRALHAGGAAPVVVVVPPRSLPGAGELAAEAEHAGACVVVADPPPPDMRASVEHGLDLLGRSRTDLPATVLLTPGDIPGIEAALVARIVARACEAPRAIVIPTLDGRRGHPIALPWPLATEIRGLPGNVGINALVARHSDRVVTLDAADRGILDDLDTPEDYRRWVDETRCRKDDGGNDTRGGTDACG
jgi:CTP:molybdopterin cytidylyltransferase MocA